MNTAHNHCHLPKPEQEAIEADKVAWFKAHKMLNEKSRPWIMNHLDNLPADERRELANRLNTIKQSKKND